MGNNCYTIIGTASVVANTDADENEETIGYVQIERQRYPYLDKYINVNRELYLLLKNHTENLYLYCFNKIVPVSSPYGIDTSESKVFYYNYTNSWGGNKESKLVYKPLKGTITNIKFEFDSYNFDLLDIDTGITYNIEIAFYIWCNISFVHEKTKYELSFLTKDYKLVISTYPCKKWLENRKINALNDDVNAVVGSFLL